jgi:nucleoside-diphosphate-sugar epimerase
VVDHGHGLPGEQLVPGSLGGDRDAQLATPVAHAEPQLRDASGKLGAEHQLADSRAHSAELATTAIHAPASEAMCTPSAALEAAVREAPEWVVLRYGVLYGPGTWYSRGRLMARRASRGELAADGDVSSFVHVDDAAGPAVEALAWPSGFVNVCDDAPAAGREWVPAFCRAVGVAEPVAAAGCGAERVGAGCR